jgi:hypothetical protein
MSRAFEDATCPRAITQRRACRADILNHVTATSAKSDSPTTTTVNSSMISSGEGLTPLHYCCAGPAVLRCTTNASETAAGKSVDNLIDNALLMITPCTAATVLAAPS